MLQFMKCLLTRELNFESIQNTTHFKMFVLKEICRSICGDCYPKDIIYLIIKLCIQIIPEITVCGDTFILKQYGEFYIFKNGSFELCGHSNFEKYYSGNYHRFGITAKGELFAWGKNISGTLGIGKPNGVEITNPVKVNIHNVKSVHCILYSIHAL